ncbi:MAG: tyrosine-type recombinase/integrase [Cytophagales bacterium]|nr:tyrosine-type recombinase/integrase [Bernardetiaceae bacterium]MDW8211739.1 tyrosine-type recombinase/integrase [Cytophagales bacterium]
METQLGAISRFIAYLRLQRRCSHHTQKAYHTDLQQFEQFLIRLHKGQKQSIVQADYYDIRAWTISLLEEQTLTARSINRKISTLRSFFRFAQREKIVADSPVSKCKPLKIVKKITPFLSQSDAKKLWQSVAHSPATDFKKARQQVVIALLYTSGIRLSELIHLNHNDIDFANEQIKIQGKAYRQRLVPLLAPTLDLLKNYVQIKERLFKHSGEGPLICTDKGQASYPMLIYRIVRKSLDMVTTIERRSPHVLRHSYATHLLDGGADLNAVKDLLGHSSLTATQVYTHASVEKLRKVFQEAHPRS